MLKIMELQKGVAKPQVKMKMKNRNIYEQETHQEDQVTRFFFY